MLTHANDHLKESLGPNAPIAANPFTHERSALQSHLTAGLLRHGLAPTPWQSNRTGLWDIAPEALEENHMDILPRLLEKERREPAQVRTEAKRRGHNILQILQALLDIGNPTENAPELLHLPAHEVWDLQQHHRSLISHLYVLLPIITLTGQQEPFRKKLGRVGCTLLIQLLSLRNSPESTLPDSIHAQYFGHLWTNSVPGRKSNAPSQALDWADTLAIWINPRGTLARNLGHCEEDDEEEEPPGAGPARQTLMDADSQRLGLTLLRLLRSGVRVRLADRGCVERFHVSCVSLWRPAHLPHPRNYKPTGRRLEYFKYAGSGERIQGVSGRETMEPGWTGGENYGHLAYLRGPASEGTGEDTPLQPRRGVPNKHKHS